jgi:hypothetical protein
MPDISMCSNQECEARVHCYRYRAKPSTYQSYLVIKGKEKCSHHWSTSGYADWQLVPMNDLEPNPQGPSGKGEG